MRVRRSKYSLLLLYACTVVKDAAGEPSASYEHDGHTAGRRRRAEVWLGAQKGSAQTARKAQGRIGNMVERVSCCSSLIERVTCCSTA